MSSIIFPTIFNLTSTQCSTVLSTEDHAQHSCFRSYRLLERTWIKVCKLMLSSWTYRRLSIPLTTRFYYKNSNISVSLVLCCCGFQTNLSGRFQHVIVHGSTSASLPITSEVSQGSLLGPFLFLTYMNDLLNYVSTSTGVGLFADDTKLYRYIEVLRDVLVLQEGIQGLQGLQIRSNENELCFNQSICKVLSITRNKPHLITPYTLGNDELSSGDNNIDLGVTINHNLLWNDQVGKVRSKANQMLGLIRKSTLEVTDTKAIHNPSN